jgi:hypothetical protein
MSKVKQAAELAAVLSTEMHEGHGATTKARVGAQLHPPHVVAADALALLRIGASVARWAVRACNGEGHHTFMPAGPYNQTARTVWAWDAEDDAAKDRADARALKRASDIAARYGATVEIGGDPRGYVLRLHLASGRKNCWGEGWGVA